MNPPLGSLLAASLALLAVAPPSWANEVRFPLTVDYEVLRVAVRQHLQEHAGGGLELWRSPDGCGSFVLKDATVEHANGRLKIAGPASGGAGVPIFGLCWANVSWRGYVEILARPEIGPDWQLHLRDLDAQLYDSSRQNRGIASRLFSVVKGWSEAELSTFTFDLGPPIVELSTLLGGFAGSTGAPRLAAALQTIRFVGLGVEPGGVKVAVAVDLPVVTPVPRAPEPALTRAQIKRWEAKLDDWDGFLSFVVKDLAGESADPEVRDALLGLLLDTRREVVGVLARGPEAGTDAVRQIFLSTWDRLRAIVRRTAVQPRDDLSRAFRYVVFLAAGDALAAIDAAAPAAGLDFSADGLRRLAKSLVPGFAGDPLEQSEGADPRLQQLFRFRDPDDPPRRPRRKLPGSSWNWLVPRPAHAGEADEWRDLATRLDRWVPVVEELPIYRATVDRLLTVAAARSLDPDALDERFDDLFHHVVKATAWQESCWRQFVRQGGTVTHLESSTGDVGLMQINARIWRGLFNGVKLRRNAAYNAGAGAEILQQLLIRYGTREARTRIENAARATYSAYHAGPARYRRYRTATAASPGWAVDRAFWKKYQQVAAGTADDDVLCLPRRMTSS
jgi:transglycosylase-like protein with SLT domain